MIEGQARRYLALFDQAGFEGVIVERAKRVGRDTWKHAYLVTGFVVAGGVRTRFEIRSARSADMFLATNGQRG